jgi:hypothetical protein
MYELYNRLPISYCFHEIRFICGDHRRLRIAESKNHLLVGINSFILKLFPLMYVIKLWFYSVLPGKCFNRTVNQPMVKFFYAIPNSEFITSFIFDALCAL